MGIFGILTILRGRLREVKEILPFFFPILFGQAREEDTREQVIRLYSSTFANLCIRIV